MSTIASPAEPNIRVLAQAVNLIAGIGDEVFVREIPLAPGGSVGKHLRHCLDFHECFLRGLPGGLVDYTHRDRDARVETERYVARQRLKETIGRLATLRTGTHRTILVRDETAPDAGEAGWSGSTVQRELQFLLSHTVHHFALVAMVLRAQGIDVGPRFGIAPSTLRHRLEQEQLRSS